MSHLRVDVDPRALRQIDDAYDWWAEHRSGEQARRWLKGIEKAISRLGAKPSRHAKAPEHSLFAEEIHQLFFGLGRRPTHRILFTIRPDSVYVLSVRHVSQDELTSDDLA